MATFPEVRADIANEALLDRISEIYSDNDRLDKETLLYDVGEWDKTPLLVRPCAM